MTSMRSRSCVEIDDIDTTTIELRTVSNISVLHRVTDEVKVLEVKGVQTIRNCPMQDVIIADWSGMARITLWGRDINRLEDGQCYKLQNLIIRDFQGSRYLSMPPAAGITRIDDIGD